jgi:hypothetical protein
MASCSIVGVAAVSAKATDLDDLDSGWENDEEDSVDSGWDELTSSAGAPGEFEGVSPSREVEAHKAQRSVPTLSHEERAARAAARKQRLRAKAVEKAERRKSRASLAASKQKKSAPKRSAAPAQRAPDRSALVAERVQSAVEEGPRTPPNELAPGPARNWRRLRTLARERSHTPTRVAAILLILAAAGIAAIAVLRR